MSSEKDHEGMGGSCPKCGSGRWMTGLPLVQKNEPSICVVPATWKDSSKGKSGLHACSCDDCGYTEFYTLDPLAVWREWQMQNR